MVKNMRPACVDCGIEYGARFFLWLPDDQWKSLGYDEKDYACPNCMVTRMNSLFKKTFNFAFMFMANGSGDQMHEVKATDHTIVLYEN